MVLDTESLFLIINLQITQLKLIPAVIMVETDDHSIIKKIRLGDVESFSVLVDRYQAMIYRLSYYMTGSKEDARDLTQEVFIRAYLNLDKVDPQYKFFSWLYRIAVNESLNYVKRKRSFATLEELEVADSDNPDEKERQAEEKRFVSRAVLQLRPRYRILVVMKYYTGLSYNQMSTITGITENKVKSRLFEARQILRNILREHID